VNRLENVRCVQYPLILFPTFFTSFYFFYSSRPFPRSFHFFLFVSHWVTRISLRSIEHHRKKHRNSFDNFPLWKELSRKKKKSRNEPIHSSFYTDTMYKHLCKISINFDKLLRQLWQYNNCTRNYLNFLSWNRYL